MRKLYELLLHTKLKDWALFLWKKLLKASIISSKLKLCEKLPQNAPKMPIFTKSSGFAGNLPKKFRKVDFYTKGSQKIYPI